MIVCTLPNGRPWNLLDPKVEDVSFTGIAHNLSCQPRFNGSLGRYSVAEHCVHVHDEAQRRAYPKPVRLLALLHDAHEAMIGDITTPVVQALDYLSKLRDDPENATKVSSLIGCLKHMTDRVIFTAANLPEEVYLSEETQSWIRQLDLGALKTEKEYLQPDSCFDWGSWLEEIKPLTFTPRRWDQSEAYQAFMHRLEIYLPIKRIRAA